MELLKNKKVIFISIGICILIICVVVCAIIENKSDNELQNSISIVDNDRSEQKDNREAKQKIMVHVAGEVNNPGIVEVEEGSRLKDAVESAGGFTDEANQNKVNLAYEVKDEQKIVIPNIKQNDEDISVVDNNEDFIENSMTKGTLVNINTATQSELESLTGIGPSMASKIIDYRDKNGKFKSKEDIKNVPGIGSSKYESIKDEITTK